MQQAHHNTVEAIFLPGAVVQLRSGGPLLTVISVDGFGTTVFIYFNTVSGLFEKATTNQACLRDAHGRPEVPKSAADLRNSGLAR